MKFLQIIVLLIVFICVIDSKKTHKKNKSHQSQYGRNYRKGYPDPSFNPLPREYETAPITDYAPISPKKYRDYNRYISIQNRYGDSTAVNAQIGAGKPVSYNLHKRKGRKH